MPKDGPSAGVTLTTALVSCLSGIPVRGDVAMTGEITLHGNVLPIGGLREKSMAAYREGMKTVLIPKDNEPDLYDVDDDGEEEPHLPAHAEPDAGAERGPAQAPERKEGQGSQPHPCKRKRRQTPPLCRPPQKSPSPARCAENRAGRQMDFSANSKGFGTSRRHASHCRRWPRPQAFALSAVLLGSAPVSVAIAKQSLQLPPPPKLAQKGSTGFPPSIRGETSDVSRSGTGGRGDTVP